MVEFCFVRGIFYGTEPLGRGVVLSMKGARMAARIEINVERLPEGVYLATSHDVPGLTVETETREEAQRIAPEVALDLIEEECGTPVTPRPEFVFKFD